MENCFAKSALRYANGQGGLNVPEHSLFIADDDYPWKTYMYGSLLLFATIQTLSNM
jgi:hypothetical protein